MCASRKVDETREGVELTNLDGSLFDGSGFTKRDLVDYLDAVSDRLLAEVRDRPLSVIRVHRGQDAFMQKNVPTYAPDFVKTVGFWAEASKREVHYALCNDRPTLLWFGNQRAIEYHPTLVRADDPSHPTHLVLDLDPPEGDGFAAAVQGARLVREVLDAAGLACVVKTSGAKGVHVFVPVAGIAVDDAAAATRAIAARAEALDPEAATTAFVKEERGGKVFIDATRVGSATVAAAYSPRVRPGAPVSFPVRWDDLDAIKPGDFTIASALDRLDEAGPWIGDLSDEQRQQAVPADLVEEGHQITPGRVEAMHEGKRRKRAAEQGGG
ncbi:MAG: DNA polymerase domain-containing protein [Aquihabitans sp.]